MNMRMIIQGPPPCVQNAEETGCVTADEFFILRQFFNGFRRRFEHGIIGNTLMTSDKWTDFGRHGKCDHKMMRRNLPFDLNIHPVQSLLVLSRRTVTIAALARKAVCFMIFAALIHGKATGGCPAADDSVDNFEMVAGHPVAVRFRCPSPGDTSLPGAAAHRNRRSSDKNSCEKCAHAVRDDLLLCGS